MTDGPSQSLPPADARPAPASGVAADRPYRPEIDGLRAISVLAVLFYHAGLSWFGGGFVGVDVFFVISGLLITQIILDQSGGGNFSFARFYERRARRLLPALFAMLAACCVAALVLLPDDLKNFSSSVIAVVTFCSNFLFWYQQRAYFAPTADSLPLLHTWSLGIEEQFYLLFPIVLIVVQRVGRRAVAPFVVAVLLVSFGYSLWAAHRDPMAAFYSPASRAWELMLGAVLATGIVPLPKTRGIGDTACLLGLAAILCAVYLPHNIAAVPGAAIVLACLGAALLLHGAQVPDSTFARALSVRPLTAIGKASYSLYLWHWPIIIFGTYYVLDPQTANVVRIACALVAIPVAFLSWRFIEQPLRGRAGLWPRRTILVRALAAGALFVLAGAAGLYLKGAPTRFDKPMHDIFAAGASGGFTPCPKHQSHRIAGESICQVGDLSEPPQFVFWGDSYTAMYGRMIDVLARRYGVSGYIAARGKCPPLPGIVTATCAKRNEAIIRFVEETHPAAVILAARWGLRATGEDPRLSPHFKGATPTPRERKSEAAFAAALATTVNRLVAAHARVYFVSDIAEAPFDVADAVAKAHLTGASIDTTLSRAQYELDMAAVTQAVAALAARGLITTIDPQNILCDAKTCRMTDRGLPLYRDANHLSKAGAQVVAPAFEPPMKALAPKAPTPAPHS